MTQKDLTNEEAVFEAVGPAQALVRMKKGRYAALKSISCPPYYGQIGKQPFDARQAQLNREAGLC